MPRKPRVEYAGFHHIINRGVARGNVFLKTADFERFLEILAHTTRIYDFEVHSLCLMDNHYHLLIETKKENLSLLARQINSKYAQYFNKEYKRVGPLWQGRFKSWYVYDEIYLSSLIRYIEQNPIKAEIVKKIGEYKWSASTLLFNRRYASLFEKSCLLEKVVFLSLDSPLNAEEKESLDKLHKTNYKRVEGQVVQEKQQSLEEYFKNTDTLKLRNNQVMLAIKDGYKQSEIAKHLGVTSALISDISRSFKFILPQEKQTTFSKSLF